MIFWSDRDIKTFKELLHVLRVINLYIGNIYSS